MFKLAKRLVGAAILLIMLLVVVGVIVFWRIDSLAKQGIERGSTYALGVPTTLRGADVGILGGTLELDGLNIANPEGFGAPTFLTLEDGKTKVSLASLRKDTIVIPELRLEDADITLIRRPGQSANYQVILENLKKLGGPGKPREPTGEPAAEKRLIVNELVLRDITIHYDPGLGGSGSQLAQAAGQLAKVTIPIDEIRLTDIGKTGSGVGGSGVTIGELSGIIVEAILAAAAEKGGDLLPAELLGDLKTQLAQFGRLDELVVAVKTQLQELGQKVREAKSPEDVKQVIDEGQKKVEEITEGLKGIIPKRQ
jgi:hypothetical protein